MYHAMACLTVPKLSYLGEHSEVSQARSVHACWTRMLYHDRLETIDNSQSTNSDKTLKIFNVYSSLIGSWLRLLYYCILHWGRPVSKSRQIELSHIASRTNMRRFWYVAISKILNALIALFDERRLIRKYFTKHFQIPWLGSIYSVLMCLYRARAREGGRGRGGGEQKWSKVHSI